MEIENKTVALGRKKGKPKSGGRRKGTPNKMTRMLKTKVERILSLSLKGIEKDMKKMKTQDKIQLVSALTKFALPTAVHLEHDGQTNFTITWKEQRIYDPEQKTV